MHCSGSSLVWSSAIFILLLGPIVVLSQEIHDAGYINTCPKPVAPKNAVISRLAFPRFYDMSDSDMYHIREHHENDKVYFQCKDGFSPISDQIMYITCGTDGKWFPNVRRLAWCLPNRVFGNCGKNFFSCKSSRKCIPSTKRCDCYSDCDDSSDEWNCDIRQRVILARTTGRDSAGVITSPGYPRSYPGNFSCVYYIYTDEKHRIQVNFEDFNLRPERDGSCVDFIRITGIQPDYLAKPVYTTNLMDEKFADLSETRCGDNKFPMLISNSTQLTVQVNLNTQYDVNIKGFSLWWQVKTLEKIAKYPKPNRDDEAEESMKKEAAENESSGEAVYTVLTPIAISAVLPLSLIIFLCCHKRLRKYADQKSQSGTSCVKSSESPEPNERIIQPLPALTEVNLAQYEYELAKPSNREYFNRSLITGGPLNQPSPNLSKADRHTSLSSTGDSGKSSEYVHIRYTENVCNREPVGAACHTQMPQHRDVTAVPIYIDQTQFHNGNPSPVHISSSMHRTSPVGMSSVSGDYHKTPFPRGTCRNSQPVCSCSNCLWRRSPLHLPENESDSFQSSLESLRYTRSDANCPPPMPSRQSSRKNSKSRSSKSSLNSPRNGKRSSTKPREVYIDNPLKGTGGVFVC